MHASHRDDRGAAPVLQRAAASAPCGTHDGVSTRRISARAVAGLSALIAVAVLPGCAPGASANDAPPGATQSTPAPSPPPPPTPAPTPIPLHVAVQPYREPDDHAHRNYCGAGATEVLVSAWLPVRPDVETVARDIHLNPDTGATGADTVAGINALLRPTIGADPYRGDHVTTLDGVLQRLRASLGSSADLGSFSHTAPVMVQTMTKTMPGWRGWQATHMITVGDARLDSGDPNLDTVTYAETPSTIAGYNGPDFQTITVAALWTAMQAFLADDPHDPVNVIW
jgi:hypothetical protein